MVTQIKTRRGISGKNRLRNTTFDQQAGIGPLTKETIDAFKGPFTSKPIVTISIIVHSKSASRGDASASLTAGADLVQSDPKESLPPLTRLIKKDKSCKDWLKDPFR
ncbi:hypothetical protein Tco_0554829 [Tanacetum coccineum]